MRMLFKTVGRNSTLIHYMTVPTLPETFEPSHDQLSQSAAELLEPVIAEATQRSHENSNSESLAQNCTFNAYALESVLDELDVPTRVVRGAVVGRDDPFPADIGIESLDEYIGKFGNGHWWVEAQLTADTWWTVDIYTIHPVLEGEPLVMAGRPLEYIAVQIDPTPRPLGV